MEYRVSQSTVKVMKTSQIPKTTQINNYSLQIFKPQSIPSSDTQTFISCTQKHNSFSFFTSIRVSSSHFLFYPTIIPFYLQFSFLFIRALESKSFNFFISSHFIAKIHSNLEPKLYLKGLQVMQIYIYSTN